MHYGNKTNFEGLLELSETLKNTTDLVGLAKYCMLREKGLRREAMRQMDHFLTESSAWNTQQARRNVITILELQAGLRAHQFLTHPILTKLVYPTLEKWVVEEPHAIEPLRWIGLLRSDRNALQLALTFAPQDIPVRRKLIRLELADADHDTHHLCESILLSTVEQTRTSIDTARNLIVRAPDIHPFADLSAEADYYEQLLNDWIAYKRSPVGTFPEWCVAQGRMHSWPTTVYYVSKPKGDETK